MELINGIFTPSNPEEKKEMQKKAFQLVERLRHQMPISSDRDARKLHAKRFGLNN